MATAAKKYSEQLRERVEEKWQEVTGDRSGEGRGFDPTIILTIIQAVMGFIQMCRPQPAPAPAERKKKAATSKDLEASAPVMVGMKLHLRRETRNQYGRRRWRDVWEDNGDDMLETARGVASTATHEEVEGLRKELRDSGVRFASADDDDLRD